MKQSDVLLMRRHTQCVDEDCRCYDDREVCICPVVASESITAVAQDVTLNVLNTPAITETTP